MNTKSQPLTHFSKSITLPFLIIFLFSLNLTNKGLYIFTCVCVCMCVCVCLASSGGRSVALIISNITPCIVLKWYCSSQLLCDHIQ